MDEARRRAFQKSVNESLEYQKCFADEYGEYPSHIYSSLFQRELKGLRRIFSFKHSIQVLLLLVRTIWTPVHKKAPLAFVSSVIVLVKDSPFQVRSRESKNANIAWNLFVAIASRRWILVSSNTDMHYIEFRFQSLRLKRKLLVGGRAIRVEFATDYSRCHLFSGFSGHNFLLDLEIHPSSTSFLQITRL